MFESFYSFNAFSMDHIFLHFSCFFNNLGMIGRPSVLYRLLCYLDHYRCVCNTFFEIYCNLTLSLMWKSLQILNYYYSKFGIKLALIKYAKFSDALMHWNVWINFGITCWRHRMYITTWFDHGDSLLGLVHIIVGRNQLKDACKIGAQSFLLVF